MSPGQPSVWLFEFDVTAEENQSETLEIFYFKQETPYFEKPWIIRVSLRSDGVVCAAQTGSWYLYNDSACEVSLSDMTEARVELGGRLLDLLSWL